MIQKQKKSFVKVEEDVYVCMLYEAMEIETKDTQCMRLYDAIVVILIRGYAH